MTIQNISTHLSNIIPRVLKMILIMFLLGLAAVLIVALAKISYELFMMALGPAPIVPNQLAEQILVFSLYFGFLLHNISAVVTIFHFDILFTLALLPWFV